MAFFRNLFRAPTNPTQTPAQGVNVQSSVYGKPIPIVYGTTKVAGNLMLYGNFTSTTQSTGGGGKGNMFGGGRTGTTQFTYFAAFAFALSDGPVQNIGTVWVGQALHTMAQLGFTLFTGTYPQTPWGTTVSWTVTDANGVVTSGTSTPIGYNGIAYVANPSYNLGSATNIPNLQFELNGIFSNSVAGQVDATAADIVGDFLTNAHYGLGFPIARVGSLNLWRNYTIAAGLLTSPAYDTQRSASDMIDELCLATNSAAFWSSGKLNVTPYGDQAITVGSLTTTNETDFVPNGAALGAWNAIKVAQAATWANDLGVTYVAGGSGSLTNTSVGPWTAALSKGFYFVDVRTGIYYFSNSDIGAQVQISYQWAAGASYQPYLTPIYSLTDNDYMRAPQNNTGASSGGGGGGPVLMTRKRKSDKINSVKVEYLDRNNSYNPAVAYAENQAEIDSYGKRTNGSKQLHLFCNATAANLSANLQLRRELVNNIYTFDLDQRYILLDPMDIIELNDTNLGLSNQLVRIVEIDENDDGTLSFTCEDALLGTGQAPAYSFGTQQGQPFVNLEAAPGMITAPVFMEVPFTLTTDLEVWVAVSAPASANWGGADCWVSTDGINYQLQERINGGARMGVLTATLPTYVQAGVTQLIDQQHTLSIDLTESNGTLTSASQQQATNLASLCWVDGELVSYANAVLTGSNKYNLTYLVRGAYNSTVGAHAINSNFVRLDNQGILKLPFTSDRVGQTIYVKFVSFNKFGGGQGTLASATAYSYTIKGTALSAPPADITNLAEVFVGNLAELSWTEVTDPRAILYEVRVGASFNNGQFLTRQAHPPFRVMGDGTYWVAVYTQPIAGLVIYSANPPGIVVVGSNVTDNIFVTRTEDPGWAGTLSGAVSKVGTTIQSNGLGGGTYTIPTGDRVTISYPFACAVIMKWTSIGQPLFNSIFAYKGGGTITAGSATVTGMVLLTSTACILNGGSTVTGISNTTGLTSGEPISGTGISTGTLVLQVLSSNSITMTNPATVGSTAAPSTQTLTFYPDLQVGFVIQTSTTIIPSGVTIASLVSTDPSAAVMSTTALLSSTSSTIQVSINWTGSGDFFGAGAVANTLVLPYLRTSQDQGVTWSTWQQWRAGYYKGSAFDAQMLLQTQNILSVAILENWQFSIDVPDRTDHYSNLAISSLGSTLVFRPDLSVTSTSSFLGSTAAFNGGQDASTKVTVLAAPSTTTVGSVIASNISLNSCLLNAYSSVGTQIAMSANVVAEGF